MKNIRYFLLILAASLIFPTYSIAQDVSSEAQRHMIRGEAALEEAETEADFKDAVQEFKRATQLAPNWANAWFNLGVAQDRAGDFAGAINSFKKYLALNPNASDKVEVDTLIIKLEYKQDKATRKKLEEKEEIRQIVRNLAEWWIVKGTDYALAPDNYWKLIQTGETNFDLVWQYLVKKSGDTSEYGNFTAVIKVKVEGLKLSGTQYFSGYYGDLADDFGCEGWKNISPITGTISEDGNVIHLADGDHRAFLHCKWIDVSGYARVFERKQ